MHWNPLEHLHSEISVWFWSGVSSVFTIIELDFSKSRSHILLPLHGPCRHLWFLAVSPCIDALRAQHRAEAFNPLLVFRELLSVPLSNPVEISRQNELWISSVWVQNHRSVRDHLLHLVPVVEAQVIGYIHQSSWHQLWVTYELMLLLDSFHCCQVVL